VAWRLGFLPDEGAHQLPRPLRFIGPSTRQRSAQTAARPHRRPEHDATLPGRRRHHQTTRPPKNAPGRAGQNHHSITKAFGPHSPARNRPTCLRPPARRFPTRPPSGMFSHRRAARELLEKPRRQAGRQHTFGLAAPASRSIEAAQSREEPQAATPAQHPSLVSSASSSFLNSSRLQPFTTSLLIQPPRRITEKGGWRAAGR
jgi:hypothetical protein